MIDSEPIRHGVRTLLACLLAGCSTNYMPPSPSAAASLQFINNTAVPMAVHLYDEAAQCKGRHVLRSLTPQEERVVLVPGGLEVAFAIGPDVRAEETPRMQVDRIPTGCVATLAFKPAQGASYVFRMDADVYRCIYRFSDAAQAPQGPSGPVPFVKREAIRAGSEAGPFCR